MAINENNKLIYAIGKRLYERTRDIHPQLTSTDCAYLLAIYLGYENNEAATVLGIEHSTLYSRLSKLRKNFDLENRTKIDSIIDAVFFRDIIEQNLNW